MLQALRTATLLKKTLTQVFSCEYCEIFKNTYYEELLGTAASEHFFTVEILVEGANLIQVLN